MRYRDDHETILEAQIGHLFHLKCVEENACEDCGVKSIMPPKWRDPSRRAILAKISPSWIEDGLRVLGCMPKDDIAPLHGTSDEDPHPLVVPNQRSGRSHRTGKIYL